MKKILLTLVAVLLLGIQTVKAHCPLCTIGAIAVAGGASYLGVNGMAIGLFIGAFAMSTGWWISRLIKRQFIPYQKVIILILSFVSVVLPVMPFLSEIKPLFISWIGQYGTTFVIDTFLIGSLVGGFIICVTPWMSMKITSLRNGNMIPFQGIILTLGLLIILGTIMQIAL